MSGADEPAAEPRVDRGEHDVLHRRPDVDPPVRDRPVDLRAVVLDLVRLLVAAVVDLLAHARDELGGALADPGPKPASRSPPRRRSGRSRGAAPDRSRRRAAGPG